MTWNAFDQASALEREMLLKALPLVATNSSGERRVRIDLAGQTPPRVAAHVAVSLSDAVGATPGGCVELLGIRPLLFGTAWKVFDLLVEEAYLQAGKVADQPPGMKIETKQKHARAEVGRPAAFTADLCRAITQVYDKTSEVRHSLVHRRVFTDSSGALVGHDKGGGRLRPVSTEEQEALGRSALRFSEMIVRQQPDSRLEADLRTHLATLSAIHGVTFASSALPHPVSEVTVVVGKGADRKNYVLSLPAVRAHPQVSSEYADLVVEFVDRPGQALRGRLEDAPDEVVVLDPNQPPVWLG